MPFGPYADFDTCVAQNGDKSSPEGFCAWLHHKILGTWPSGMSADKFPESWLNAYDAALVAQKSEAEAFKAAEAAAEEAGFERASFGWVKQYQAPSMKSVKDIYIFALGTWTDSAGNERTWTGEELDRMKAAFKAGVPVMVPIKCGHTSDDFNRKIAEALEVPVEVVTGDNGQGQIKIGNMTSLERKGDWLVAAFGNIPEPIANLIEGGQYSNVSVEIEDKVGEYGPVITGVALLGAEEPAVEGATLERALVFGGTRKGARVWSFKVGDQLPDPATLRSEFDDIRSKVADIIKGKKGAPLFRALFGNITELFERMVGGRHSAPGDNAEVPEEVRAIADQEYQGNIQPLIAWAGTVGFDQCVVELTGKPGITDPVRVCGWLKGQAHSKTKEGGNSNMKEIKAFKDMKAEDIRSLKVKDLAAKLQDEGEVTIGEIVDALPEEPAKGIADIAAALGLGAEATVEEMVAAIEALKAAAPEGEMGNEFKKANSRIAVLEGEKAVRDWEDKTREFKAIPGTAHEHAVALAAIESKAGKEAAESQYAALKEANRLAEEALKIVGTSRSAGPTDFDNEVAKHMTADPKATKAEAIKAVSKARPDLYFARRQ